MLERRSMEDQVRAAELLVCNSDSIASAAINGSDRVSSKSMEALRIHSPDVGYFFFPADPDWVTVSS
jgi:hypothetical protein